MSLGRAIEALWPIFIPQAPLYLAWIVGIVLALAFWRRHPGISLLAVLGFALLLIVTAAATFLGAYWPLLLREQGKLASEIALTMGIANVVAGAVAAVAWVLLLIALFAGRRRA